ncbi:MAG: preprotein translocase subunit SecE [Candidatus Eiseniibacteriota bacterium]
MFAKAKKFVADVWIELKKVSWPSREELRGSTVVVIVAVILISVVIGVVDRILSFGLEKVLS